MCVLYEKQTENKAYKNEDSPIDSIHKYHRGHSCVLFRLSGSITAEASFCVPIFFLTVFALFYVFKCLIGINYMETELTDRARGYATYGTKLGIVKTYIDESKPILWDEHDEFPIFYTKYNQEIPTLGSKFFKIKVYQQVVIDDYSGESMAPEEDGENAETDEKVYITKNGKVYHCRSDCTYLKPSVKVVAFAQVGSKRNSSGGKYKPCERCCKNISLDDIGSVYITSYGNRYHCTKNCTEIKRDIRVVKKSEIGNMPPCSKCGKNEE